MASFLSLSQLKKCSLCAAYNKDARDFSKIPNAVGVAK
ncbi:hypothetical protein GCK32_020234 [Trichostrongylus colubriformis]|uniref:Uncharacterized protein n=1 Tax=Trichostrongylus colubriformis TaxID=6319 RepID=A0AAN8F9N4_TRICO